MIDMLGTIVECDSRSNQENEILAAWVIFRNKMIKKQYCRLQPIYFFDNGEALYILDHKYPLMPSLVEPYIKLVKSLATVSMALLEERVPDDKTGNLVYEHLTSHGVTFPKSPEMFMGSIQDWTEKVCEFVAAISREPARTLKHYGSQRIEGR